MPRKPRTINVKRKQSVYLDKDLQSAIAQDLEEAMEKGLDLTVGDIIRMRCRDSYNIPGVKRYVK